MPTTISQQIKALQTKVAIGAERAKFWSDEQSSDDEIKKELKKFVNLDGTPPTTASTAITGAQLSDDARKTRLVELAAEVDREMAYAFMMKKLGVSYEFQNERLLKTKEENQVRTPAEVIAQSRRSEKVAKLLTESMQNSTESVEDHLTAMMDQKHKLIDQIASLRAGAAEDPLTKSAIEIWNKTKDEFNNTKKSSPNPHTFHKAYLTNLEAEAKNNPGLTDPAKNALLAVSSQMNMMAEVGAEITEKQKITVSDNLMNDSWEIDPRPAPEQPADPSAKPVEKETRLEAALASLKKGNPSPTKPQQKSLELEKQVLEAFDKAVKELNKATRELKEALLRDRNPTSADIAAKIKAVEKADLTVAGMLANPTQKNPLQTALSKDDLNATLSELAHVRRAIAAITRETLNKKPETVDEMNPDPAKKPNKKTQQYAWEELTKLPPEQEVFVTFFEYDEVTNEIKEKELLDSKGNPIKPTVAELTLAVNKINKEVDEMNARAAGSGVKKLEHATIKIDNKGNYVVTWPNKQLNKKFQEAMIDLQDTRLAKNATNQANTSPATPSTEHTAIPDGAEADKTDETQVIHRRQMN